MRANDHEDEDPAGQSSVFRGWDGYRRVKLRLLKGGTDSSFEQAVPEPDGPPPRPGARVHDSDSGWNRDDPDAWERHRIAHLKRFEARWGGRGAEYSALIAWEEQQPRNRSEGEDKYHQNRNHLPTVSAPEMLVPFGWYGKWSDRHWSPPRDWTPLEPFFPLAKDWLIHRTDWWLKYHGDHLDLLNDLDLRAVIRRHDRSDQHCDASRTTMAGEAGLSLIQVKKSLVQLSQYRGPDITQVEPPITEVGNRGKLTRWATTPDGNNVGRDDTVPLYEWIMARRELSITARFLCNLGAEVARLRHRAEFKLTSPEAAGMLAVSDRTAKRAFQELERWRLISEIEPFTYVLNEHPWHYFHFQRLHTLALMKRQEQSDTYYDDPEPEKPDPEDQESSSHWLGLRRLRKNKP